MRGQFSPQHLRTADSCSQVSSLFFRTFTTLTPFRDGLLDILSYVDIYQLVRTCKGLFDERDKSFYLDVVGIVVGSPRWVRKMRRCGYTFELLGSAKCNTLGNFVSFSQAGRTLLLVSHRESQHLLNDEDLRGLLEESAEGLVTALPRDGLEPFMASTVECGWNFCEPQFALFKTPESAAMSGTARPIISFRPGCYESDSYLFSTPVEDTVMHVLRTGSLLIGGQVDQIRWREYSEEDFNVLLDVGNPERPLLVFDPKDWDRGTEKKIVAAIV